MKVNETHKRSLLKGVTAKILEILFDFMILNLIFQRPLESFGVAVGIEVVCYILSYINERIWNKLKWGRRIYE